MEQRAGLRERKKNATWGLLRATALEMFSERGYENVSVAEIAAAAEVSKATVFNYFPTKEDLVIGGMKAHTGDPAETVRTRPAGQTPHAALRDRFLGLLEHHAPQTGLNDNPFFLKVQRLLHDNPALVVSSMNYRRQSAVLLAAVLVEEGNAPLTSNLVSSQLMHTQQILIEVNARSMLEGTTPGEFYHRAVTGAKHAFGLLENGIGDLMRRGENDVAFAGEALGFSYEREVACAREQVEQVERALGDTRDDLFEGLADPDRLSR